MTTTRSFALDCAFGSAEDDHLAARPGCDSIIARRQRRFGHSYPTVALLWRDGARRGGSCRRARCATYWHGRRGALDRRVGVVVLVELTQDDPASGDNQHSERPEAELRPHSHTSFDALAVPKVPTIR